MDKSRKALKIAAFVLYFALLFFVSAKLFLEKQFDAAISHLFSTKNVKEYSIAIGYADSLINLNPLANDTGSRARLLHIFEPLVRVSADLQLEPALAISYGAVDDLTWEFRLRPDVLFHSGKTLIIEDVIFSLEEAKNNALSGVKDLASVMKEIRKVDDSVFRIITNEPDPLLLQKVSSFLIFSKENEGKAIGTGPYVLEKNENGTVVLQRFDKYWGTRPFAKDAFLKTLAKKDEKIAALQNRSVDILANLPADLATKFAYGGFKLQGLPSLEVNFLMFNFDKAFSNRILREAVALALKTDQLAKLAQGFAVPADQFVGNGIFGYNPEIQKRMHNMARAMQLAREALGDSKATIVLDLPKGLEVFGENVKEHLGEVGIEVVLNFLQPSELGRKIASRESEFYFFGWRCDLGDAADFLTAVAHSPSGNFGQFNGGNYKNSEVDQLIETSQSTLKQDDRLKLLRAAMKRITVDDIIGVPLFSPEVLYGVSEKLKWKPRVDGYVLAQEVKM